MTITTIKAKPIHNQSSSISHIPGDKSMSHRAIIIGSLIENRCEFHNFLTAEDCLNTLSIFQELGVDITREGDRVVVNGVGIRGLKQPAGTLDVGNSGTGIRLITGVLAGQSFDTKITGDDSIQRRPMKRIIDPLSQMRAKIEGQSLPGKTDIYPELSIKGQATLSPMTYTLPVASAQVKSAVLLAGLYADGPTTVIEPEACRDHTERYLKGFGASLEKNGDALTLTPGTSLRNPSSKPIHIPSDISSAAFFIVLGTLLKNSELTITGIGINPTRDAVLTALMRMGADITLTNEAGQDFEPYADIVVRSSQLKGIHLPEFLVPFLIDEIPVLAVAAMFAEGTFKVTGAKELRVKESDRIASIVQIVKAFGGTIREYEDGFEIDGGMNPGTIEVQTHHDHRIAMSTFIGAAAAGVEATVYDTEFIQTSFPNFFDLLSGLGSEFHDHVLS